MLKNRRWVFLLVLSCLWAFACSPGPDASSTAQETRSVSVARVQAQDFAPGQLEAHFAKHGAQFGAITINQYLSQARDLLDAPAGKDILEKTRANGDILHYRASTGEFAVMTATGRIRTYFKADLRYWMRQ
jgi:pyocin large subunit-like protein